MMKVSDPIIFGHVVKAFFPDVFAQYGDDLAAAGLSPNNGLGGDPRRARRAAQRRRDQGRDRRRASPTGRRWRWSTPTRASPTCTCPSDVIVDASMPAMIRTSGHMWGPDGDEADTLAVIPDSSYAGVYQTVIDDCRANGAFDPTTMGSVPNVGLMAQAAEEYGCHDKTFEIADGRHGPGRRRRRHRAARARRRARRHLARLPDQGRPDPRLGQARRHPRPRVRHARRCSGSTRPAPTTPT